MPRPVGAKARDDTRWGRRILGYQHGVKSWFKDMFDGSRFRDLCHASGAAAFRPRYARIPLARRMGDKRHRLETR